MVVDVAGLQPGLAMLNFQRARTELQLDAIGKYEGHACISAPEISW